jgi:hypothetical protein
LSPHGGGKRPEEYISSSVPGTKGGRVGEEEGVEEDDEDDEVDEDDEDDEDDEEIDDDVGWAVVEAFLGELFRRRVDDAAVCGGMYTDEYAVWMLDTSRTRLPLAVMLRDAGVALDGVASDELPEGAIRLKSSRLRSRCCGCVICDNKWWCVFCVC